MAELDLQPEPELDIQPVLDLQPVEKVDTGVIPWLKNAFAGAHVAGPEEYAASLAQNIPTAEDLGKVSTAPIGGGITPPEYTPGESVPMQYLKGAGRAGAGLYNAVISPAGLATVGSFALGQPEIGAALIAAQLAPGAGQFIEKTGEAVTGKLSPGEAVEHAINVAAVLSPLVHEAVPKAAEFKPVETPSTKSEFPVSQEGVTEPPPVPKEFLPEKTSVTADLTRQLTDARKGLLAEAQDLQTQADISRAATGTVHPAVQERITAINEELAHPTVGVPIEPSTPVDVVLKSQGITPDEATTAVAVSPASTTPGDVVPGQAAPQPPGAVGVGGGPPVAAVGQGGGAPVVGGLARSTIEDQINAGILPPDALVIGKGWNAAEAAARGDLLINQGVNPDMVLEAIQGKRKFPGNVRDAGDAVAVLQSETRRFAAERAAAQNQFGLGSPQARAAELTENNWLKNTRPKAGGLANRVMKAFEDTTPVDLGKYDDLYNKAIKLADGKDISMGQMIEMQRKAAKVTTARTQVGEALGKRQKIVDESLPRVKVPLKEEMKAIIDDMVKELTPCK